MSGSVAGDRDSFQGRYWTWPTRQAAQVQPACVLPKAWLLSLQDFVLQAQFGPSGTSLSPHSPSSAHTLSFLFLPATISLRWHTLLFQSLIYWDVLWTSFYPGSRGVFPLIFLLAPSLILREVAHPQLLDRIQVLRGSTETPGAVWCMLALAVNPSPLRGTRACEAPQGWLTSEPEQYWLCPSFSLWLWNCKWYLQHFFKTFN